MDQREWVRKNKLPLYTAITERNIQGIQLNQLIQTKRELLGQYRLLEKQFAKESQRLVKELCTVSQLIDDINEQMYNKSKKEIL